MCGPAGSGKTTYARGLEHNGLVRLSIDEEAWARGYRRQPLAEEVAAQIEAELRARLVALVQAGRDVVVDFAFWSRQARADYRRLLTGLGVQAETVYLATPREVVLARVAERSGDGADDVLLDPATAASYFDHFEAPGQDEGPLHVGQG